MGRAMPSSDIPKEAPHHASRIADAGPPGAYVEHGQFEFAKLGEDFDLRPREHRTMPISEDQRKISQEVYEARNVLKLLEENKRLQKKAYHEFIERVIEAGRAGCAADVVDPVLAKEALAQIRAEILRRVRVQVVYRYIAYLAGWAAGVATIAAAFIYIVKFILLRPDLENYGWVIIGAMVGAWLFAAVRRHEVAFDDIGDFVNSGVEPAARVLYVGVLAIAVAVMLQFKLIDLGIADINFADFTTSVEKALILGFVAGIAERTLSLQVTGRVLKGTSGNS